MDILNWIYPQLWTVDFVQKLTDLCQANGSRILIFNLFFSLMFNYSLFLMFNYSLFFSLLYNCFGLFVKQNCTQTSDTVCDVLSGYFCKSLTDTGCSTAEKHSVCEPGQRIKQPGTSRHDTVCEACQEGSFSPDGLNCTLWTECSASQTKVQEGSLTSDVVCRNVSIRHRYTLLVPVLSLPIVCMLLLTGLC
uniref:Tumor necrosis factor receptor superfamily member 14 n=1 Tax=Fundulus heteroclitus TaxID=8078 RepID=A0A3Q2PI78_FUNHE